MYIKFHQGIPHLSLNSKEECKELIYESRGTIFFSLSLSIYTAIFAVVAARLYTMFRVIVSAATLNKTFIETKINARKMTRNCIILLYCTAHN